MPDERSQWVARLDRVARPVLTSLARHRLKAAMPVEQKTGDRGQYTHLEAFGRTMTGLAPWLALDGAALPDAERALHEEYRTLLPDAVAAAVLNDSPDRMNFEGGGQPIVDTAFLAHAVVRAPDRFKALPPAVLAALVNCLQAPRKHRPAANNWLLFAAITEAVLYVLTGAFDPMRVDYAVRQHEQWYLGGGVYGDGPLFHADYYNSFVIQPMLIDVLRTLGPTDESWAKLLGPAVTRAQRYAEIQERIVAPDGSYPATGRSIAYRCGAFQLLAQMALQKALPDTLPPAKVRGVLGKVIARTLDAKDTFDAGGWLRIGLSGAQPSLGEPYVSTGSLYLCAAAFLPLGLPPADAFWADSPVPSSWDLAWGGVDLPADHG